MWLIPVSPPPMPGQRCSHPGSKCAKSIQLRDKKIYNLGGIQGWAKAVACAQAPAAFSVRGSSIWQGHPGPSKSRASGDGDLGSLE